MNRSKSLTVFTVLPVMLLTLLIISGQTSAVATGLKPVSDNHPTSFTVGKPSGRGNNQLPPMAPGVVLVGLKPDVMVSTTRLGVRTGDASLNAVFAKIGARSIEPVFPNTRRSVAVASIVGEIDLGRIYRLRLAPNADILRAIRDLNANPAVAYAEPDYLAHVIVTPNDPLYPGQWGLTQTNAPAAWDVVTGTTDVVIAIVDSGLDTSHPDLAGRLWTNPGETAGNGLDDDNNGYMDDIHGWNIVDDNANLSDNTGHGTQVAGVIAAATDNGLGVAGVCWNCRLMIIKVTRPGGVANYSDIAAGVVYAAQKGAEVINLSLGGYSDSTTLRAAIERASQTAVVVGGAGNDNTSDSFYPAAYDDYVLAVAGTTGSDTKVSTSNYGTWVDVSAPGEVITTTFSGGGYGSASGTSMAVSFVSGLAGLLRSQHPGWSPDVVRAQIVHTTDDIDGLNPGYEGQLGSGRIDASQAVVMTAQPLLAYQSHTVDGEPDGRPEPGSTVDLDVTLYNDWADATDVQATLSTTDPYVTIVTGTASYGSIAAYESGTSATPFRFGVSSSVPYAHDIPFALNVTADEGYATTMVFTVTTVSGTENVSGVIVTDTTWTNDKEYLVTGNILVQSGAVLTIEKGTTVKFSAGKTLQIDGALIAIGQPDQNIRFTSYETVPSAGDWNGIQFNDSSVDAVTDNDNQYISGSTLQYAIVEYATTGVLCANASPYLGHNTVRFNSNVGILAGESAAYPDSLPIVIHNVIEQNGSGLQTGNAIIVTNNRVAENSDFGIFADWGGAGHTGLLSQNLIVGNGGDGLRVWAHDTLSITNNTILGNNVGVNLEGGSSPSTPFFSHNNLLEDTLYDFNNNMNFAINVPSNWWGTTDTFAIDQKIYDFSDDFNLGVVNYTPILTSPASDAPAFLDKLMISPSSPVGIQIVTFDLTFSRSMDQSVDPVVTFGATEPYTSYVVLDNAQWITDTVWSATYDVTSLVPRGTYTISVSGAKGTNGMEIPADTRFTFTVDYAGEITDQTPPDPPWVIAGGVEGDASTVEAMWSASDPDSSITGYRYAIGSAAGATDIVNWTNTSSNSITKSGLGLVEGQQYWLAVQARNEGGLWSASGYSAFVAGQPFRRAFLPLVIRNQ